jgi:spermidine/putrescine transport system ATP-binding protein
MLETADGLPLKLFAQNRDGTVLSEGDNITLELGSRAHRRSR